MVGVFVLRRCAIGRRERRGSHARAERRSRRTAVADSAEAAAAVHDWQPQFRFSRPLVTSTRR